MFQRVQKIPLPETQVYEASKRWEIDKVKVTENVTLDRGKQTLAQVVSQRTGLKLVKPTKALCANHYCLTFAGVHEVEKNKPFHVLVANFGQHPVNVTARKAIARVSDHPTALLASKFTHGELLGVIDRTNAFRK